MRRASWLGIVLIVAAIAGCESKESSDGSDASTQPASRPSQPQFQPLKLATRPATLPLPPPDWKPSTEPFATTIPTTRQSRAVATSLPSADLLATPEATVRLFLEMCSRPTAPPLEEFLPLLIEP